MKVAQVIGGVVFACAGIVWTLQGLGSAFVPQSFMTNSRWWVIIGLVTTGTGIAVIIGSLRRH